MRRGNLNIIVLAGCIAAVALSAVLVGYSFGASAAGGDALQVAASTFRVEEPSPADLLEEPEETEEATEPPVSSGSISVPGFERLTVQGRTLKAEYISNPAQNNCYFIVSLMLEDGTEVYRSGILAPGQAVGEVGLTRSIAPRTYEGAVARYSCYSLETMQSLNGADVTFTLEVLP